MSYIEVIFLIMLYHANMLMVELHIKHEYISFLNSKHYKITHYLELKNIIFS